jgi:tetratricopeptide (TPR) repeat protein
MATIAEAFGLALQQHRAGNLLSAENLYRQILSVDTDNADVHHLLGVLVYQNGQFEQAVVSIGRAVAINPLAGVYHANLGLAQLALGQTEKAMASFYEAVRLQPNSPDAHNALGNALRVQGKLEQAIAHCQQALNIRPDFADAHNNLGNALLEQGRAVEASTHFREALRLRPDFAEAHNNLGNALWRQGNAEEAVKHCRQALQQRPQFAEALENLGAALADLGRDDEAIASFRKALDINPSNAAAWGNVGNALARQRKLEDAIGCYHEAIRLKPNNADTLNNLGNVFLRQQNLAEAIECFEQALRSKPDWAQVIANLGSALVRQGRFEDASAAFDKALSAEPDLSNARLNRGLLRLLVGDLELGWSDFEFRWVQPGSMRRNFEQPLWDGSNLAGRTILVYAEQGLGDTLQFIRYSSLVKERGGRTVVECPSGVLRLLSPVAGIDHLVASGSRPPAFDVQEPLLSLPGVFQTSLTTIPATIPYLKAEPELVHKWARTLKESSVRCPVSGVKTQLSDSGHRTPDSGRFLVGIAWQGSPTYGYDNVRSISLRQFSQFAQVRGVQLISLQKGPGTEQLFDPAIGDPFALDLGSRLDEENGSFVDTAAVMTNLDLIICSDTAVPHLAGALGIPVWVALPTIPDWRWLLEREDSPWYPSMRLFRKSRNGRWDEVFERMALELTRATEEKLMDTQKDLG